MKKKARSKFAVRKRATQAASVIAVPAASRVDESPRSVHGPRRELLFVPGKRRYVRGERPAVDCIFCAVLSRHPSVDNLTIAVDPHLFVTMNLFPYNPGHIMVVPRRHVTDPRQLRKVEREAMDRWVRKLLDQLDEIYHPMGYNIGYNIGRSAGASIDHLHLHIVPRFLNEIGFIDVIGGARVHVDHPGTAIDELRRRLGYRVTRRKK
jgi:ATP adenylyltransferase